MAADRGGLMQTYWVELTKHSQDNWLILSDVMLCCCTIELGC